MHADMMLEKELLHVDMQTTGSRLSHEQSLSNRGIKAYHLDSTLPPAKPHLLQQSHTSFGGRFLSSQKSSLKATVVCLLEPQICPAHSFIRFWTVLGLHEPKPTLVIPVPLAIDRLKKSI